MFAHAVAQVAPASGAQVLSEVGDEVRCALVVLHALTTADGDNMIVVVEQERQALVRRHHSGTLLRGPRCPQGPTDRAVGGSNTSKQSPGQLTNRHLHRAAFSATVIVKLLPTAALLAQKQDRFAG
jgi:hypothetical protein